MRSKIGKTILGVLFVVLLIVGYGTGQALLLSWTLVETTAPTGVAGSDIIYADSTLHGLKVLANNGSALPIPMLAANGTSGGIPYYAAAGSTQTSSAALTLNSPILGGGAGGAPLTVAGIITDGISKLTLGVAGGAVGNVILNNATSGSVTLAPPTGALGTPTVTTPAITGSLPTGYSCGASLAAAGACANTAQGGTFHFHFGSALLSGSTSTITGFSPAYVSATSWWCVANDITTRANPVQMIPASASTATITNTTGATDLIQFVCFGN